MDNNFLEDNEYQKLLYETSLLSRKAEDEASLLEVSIDKTFGNQRKNHNLRDQSRPENYYTGAAKQFRENLWREIRSNTRYQEFLKQAKSAKERYQFDKNITYYLNGYFPFMKDKWVDMRACRHILIHYALSIMPVAFANAHRLSAKNESYSFMDGKASSKPVKLISYDEFSLFGPSKTPEEAENDRRTFVKELPKLHKDITKRIEVKNLVELYKDSRYNPQKINEDYFISSGGLFVFAYTNLSDYIKKHPTRNGIQKYWDYVFSYADQIYKWLNAKKIKGLDIWFYKYDDRDDIAIADSESSKSLKFKPNAIALKDIIRGKVKVEDIHPNFLKEAREYAYNRIDEMFEDSGQDIIMEITKEEINEKFSKFVQTVREMMRKFIEFVTKQVAKARDYLVRKKQELFSKKPPADGQDVPLEIGNYAAGINNIISYKVPPFSSIRDKLSDEEKACEAQIMQALIPTYQGGDFREFAKQFFLGGPNKIQTTLNAIDIRPIYDYCVQYQTKILPLIQKDCNVMSSLKADVNKIAGGAQMANTNLQNAQAANQAQAQSTPGPQPAASMTPRAEMALLAELYTMNEDVSEDILNNKEYMVKEAMKKLHSLSSYKAFAQNNSKLKVLKFNTRFSTYIANGWDKLKKSGIIRQAKKYMEDHGKPNFTLSLIVMIGLIACALYMFGPAALLEEVAVGILQYVLIMVIATIICVIINALLPKRDAPILRRMLKIKDTGGFDESYERLDGVILREEPVNSTVLTSTPQTGMQSQGQGGTITHAVSSKEMTNPVGSQNLANNPVQTQNMSSAPQQAAQQVAASAKQAQQQVINSNMKLNTYERVCAQFLGAKMSAASTIYKDYLTILKTHTPDDKENPSQVDVSAGLQIPNPQGVINQIAGIKNMPNGPDKAKAINDLIAQIKQINPTFNGGIADINRAANNAMQSQQQAAPQAAAPQQ